jgi:WXG100 family type VII secretion target
MTRLVVDLDRLADLIERMDSFHQQLAAARSAVDARVRSVHVRWTGDAATAASAAQARWDAGAHEVHEALAALRSVAATVHGNYAAAVAANRRMWAL